MTANHTCIHEQRFADLESDVAELKARSDSKQSDIININKELIRDRQQQAELLKEVTKVTVLLEESQKTRDDNNKKIEELEKKVDTLQDTVIQLNSSLGSFKNTMLALIPIISIIVGIVLHFIVV